jgi:hypothetical protein
MDEPGATNPAPPPRASRAFPIVLGLCLALTGGYELGQLTHTHAGGAPGAAGAHTHGPGLLPGAEVGGLAISAGGYTLVPEPAVFVAGVSGPLRFHIVGPDRATVTRYATVAERQLHLVVVRRDLTGYQHLHPTLGADGTWSTPLLLAESGPWRIFADFSTIAASGAQTAVTLGADLMVAGTYEPRTLAAPDRAWTAGGLGVAYSGEPQVGATQPMVFQVSRAGRPVPVERYLGAYGHLVVIREGDLGYLHVHADPALVGGGIRFWLTTPSVGRYRMFLDYQTGGAVHTAEFTLEVR